ncbi:Fc receptor-like protein 5 isoform X2 [Siphateles boraxobius]|uniref:Fc receptor-like protein 5 isoform X2 n=1 Tax=Siphateles boraxobius TaxID=180520 RepID=UPI004064081C
MCCCCCGQTTCLNTLPNDPDVRESSRMQFICSICSAPKLNLNVLMSLIHSGLSQYGNSQDGDGQDGHGQDGDGQDGDGQDGHGQDGHGQDGTGAQGTKNTDPPKTVTLTCDIQREDIQWRYSWFRDDSDILHSTERDYIITSVSDGGQYRCEATRSDFSAGVTVTVSVKPVVTVTPDQPVFRGERVTLTCDIQRGGNIQWRYSWFKDGSVNPDSTERDYVTSVSDADKYRCEVTRSDISAGVTLTVSDLPTSTVTVTPDSPVFTGETVNLKCVINSGHSDWRYEWYKDRDSVKLQTSGYRYTVNRDTVTIRGVTESDQGQYRCKGQIDGRPNSSTSSSAVSLSVKDLPTSTVTVTPDSLLFTGETVNLKCVINSGHSDWRYEWYKDRDSVILKTPGHRYTVNRGTVTIRGATESDQGQYRCKGQRDGRPNSSTSSSAVSLSVKGKPVVTVKPDQHVFSGERVTLTCDIQRGGNIQWRYSWNKYGNTVYPYTTTADYSFTADVSHSGEYSCKRERSDFSDAVTLTVSDKLIVTVKPQSSVFTGDTVTLSCDVGRSTGWTFLWRKNSKWESRDDAGTKTISSVRVSDGGTYICRAQRGDYYTDSSNVKITVRERPKPVVKVKPDVRVFRGERVTLTCDIQETGVWRYSWYRDQVNRRTDQIYSSAGQDQIYIITSVDRSHAGLYRCRGTLTETQQKSEISDRVTLTVSERPKPVMTVKPDQRAFSGETVTLTCDIQREEDSQWIYRWIKDGNTDYPYTTTTTADYSFTADVSHSGKYTCRGERSDSQRSHISDAVTLTVSDLKPKPELTSDPAGAALTGNTVTLTCRMDLSTGYWDFYWYKHTLNPETEKKKTHSYSLKIDSVSDGGQYWCRAGRGKPVYYTQYSDALWVNVTESPKAVVTVRPDERVFRGETVTLRCDIKWGGDTEWTYRWEIEGTNSWYRNSAYRCTEQDCCTSGADEHKHRNAVSLCSIQELNISKVRYFHSGKYRCRGERSDSQKSNISDAVTLTVSAEAQASVRVSPQPWLTEGESVTLICEVSGSSTGWTFSWFRDHDHLSDSSRGAGGSYTLSPAALQHTGVYTCRAERGRPAYYTHNSSSHTLWITGVSASVSLVINPSRSQHFSSDSLSLSCEDQSNSAGWTVRRYTDKYTQTCAKQTGSRCVMDSLSTSDTGVYWCESESGEKRRPRNITVHDGEVILESSVDPVIEGETLTLHCLHRSTNSPILSADFYKDGSLIQNQTTGEMSITNVSKSHEGFYSCKTERGQSLHSWISVRVSTASSSHLAVGVSVGLSVCLLFFISLVLLWRHKHKKDQHCNNQQTSVPNPSGESLALNSPLQSDSDHIYDDVIPVKKRDQEPLEDVTYSEVTVKKNISVDKDETMAESNNVMYSEVGTKVKKSKNINTAGPSDLTYAQINIQDKKKSKSKGKSSESGDTLYSELKNNTDRGADAGVSDATYAQVLRKKGHKNITRP